MFSIIDSPGSFVYTGVWLNIITYNIILQANQTVVLVINGILSSAG